MKPILFSTEMVQAILEGRKTQTRRFAYSEEERQEAIDWDGVLPGQKYQPGDILWVRETFIDVGEKADQYFGGVRFHYKANEDFVGCWPWKPSIFMPREAARIFLEVTDVRAERLQDISEEDAIAEGIKMVGENPEFGGASYSGKWYDNYGKTGYTFLKPIESFQTLWQKINGKIHPWESNPWVWVYTFKRIEKPENF